MNKNKLMSREEFGNKNYNLCKFEHIFEDQENCLDCEGQPDECNRINEAFKKYKNTHTNSEAIFVMMTAQ